MAKATRLVSDEAYEEVVNSYEFIVLDLLNKELRDNGISDEGQRRKICTDFLTNLATVHDQYWIEAAGEPFYPLLCFSKESLNTDASVDGLGEVLAPSDYSFAEHVQGALSDYFNERGESAGVLIGLLGYEVPSSRRKKMHSWLKESVTLEEVEAYCRDRDETNPLCPYGGTWLEAFELVMRSAHRPGDEIWTYEADPGEWEKLQGLMGFALVRGGAVIAVLVTGKS